MFFLFSYEIGLAIEFGLIPNFTMMNPEQIHFVIATTLLSIPIDDIASNMPNQVRLNPKATLSRKDII